MQKSVQQSLWKNRVPFFVWAGLLVGVFGGYSSASARSIAVEDVRLKPFTGFKACILQGACEYEQIFHGQFAQKMKRKLPRLRKRVTFAKIALVHQVPKKWRERYLRRLKRHLLGLKAAGYDITDLQRLGQGQAVASTGADVALIFVAMTGTSKRGRTKTEHFYQVVWRLQGEWKIVFMEDFPWRWMKKHKPVSMGGKGLPTNKRANTAVKEVAPTKAPEPTKAPPVRR